MANSVLAKMAVQISANTAEFNKKISETQKSLSGFQKSTLDLAQNLGLAFGTQQVVDFAFEVSKLAGEAEGVKRAFDKLPNSVMLMQELQRVTAGTVSELDLMKRTVQAANFGISLESLPKLLEFAAVRAQQTGQSVDYLVDSIVTGIGRKSPLILDNLGISAVRLKEQFGGAALEAQSIGDVALAVGKIAEEELSKMGSMAETTATKIARLDATWQDFKVTLGQTANESGILNFFLQLGTEALKSLGGIEDATDKLRNLEYQIKRFNIEANSDNAFGGLSPTRLKELEKAAEETGKKIIILTDSATGLRRVMIDPRTPLSKPIEDISKASTEADGKVKELEKSVKKLSIASFATLGNIDFNPDELANSVERAINKINGLILDAQGNIADFSLDLIEMPEEIADSFSKIADRAVVSAEAINDALRSLVAGGITEFADGFGRALAGVGTFGDNALKAIINFARQFGAILIQLGVAALASFNLIKGPKGALAAIAAGAALVAIAGFASARLSAAQRQYNGGGTGAGRGIASTIDSLSVANNNRIELYAKGTSLQAVLTETSRKTNRTRSS